MAARLWRASAIEYVLGIFPPDSYLDSYFILPPFACQGTVDEDVQAIIAFLRSQPPASPPTNISLIGAALVTISNGAFLTAQPPITGSVTRPPEGPTAEGTRGYTNLKSASSCLFVCLGG